MDIVRTSPASPPSPVAGLALFDSLSSADQAKIAPLTEYVQYSRDDVLFFEGDPPEWLFIILDGNVKLIKHSDDGRDVILYLAMPGCIVGGVSAFGRRPHPFTAQAMVPTSALRIAGRDFAEIMEQHPKVARYTIDVLTERLIEAHETMKSLAVERVERRIARQLLKLTRRAGSRTADGIEIEVRLVRQDVADMAGTTVESAIRVLSRWRRGGVVMTRNGHLVVTDIDALTEVAESGTG